MPRRATQPRRRADCHPDREHYARGLCASCYHSQAIKQNAVKATCHPERAHYANGFCNICYQRARRAEKPKTVRQLRMATCHPDRRWYGDGLCSQCYFKRRRGTLPFVNTSNLGCVHQEGRLCKRCYSNQYTSPRKASCHPDRPLHARELCESCYRAEQNRRRDARLRGGEHHTEAQWQAQLACYPMCPRCHRPWNEVGEPTRDHMLSIAEGGDDSIQNIQPLCQSCNSQKQHTSVCYLPPSERGTSWGRPE